jgi:hypothetical protein
VDGFCLTAHEGYVVEDLNWDSRNLSGSKGGHRLSRSLGWLGEITIDMDGKTALAIAKRKLGRPFVVDGVYEWIQFGRSRPAVLEQDKPYHKWTARMAIDEGRVSMIQVMCE